MSDKPKDYGLLLNKDAKLHRWEFKQMCKLLGIKMLYRKPLNGKNFNIHGDLEANYADPIEVFVIFEEHPDQKTLKKRGWVAELQENSSMIHVPYDLEDLQVGCLFDVPSGLDDGKARRFRVISMQNIMIYPASIACEIAPEYEDTDELSTIHNFDSSTNNLLVDLEDDD